MRIRTLDLCKEILCNNSAMLLPTELRNHCWAGNCQSIKATQGEQQILVYLVFKAKSFTSQVAHAAGAYLRFL